MSGDCRVSSSESRRHLGVEAFVGERVRRELVAQEVADDPFSEDDRIQGHIGEYPDGTPCLQRPNTGRDNTCKS
jgi:hypothetical protein